MFFPVTARAWPIEVLCSIITLPAAIPRARSYGAHDKPASYLSIVGVNNVIEPSQPVAPEAIPPYLPHLLTPSPSSLMAFLT
jgi:hypothetical protein